MTTYQVFLALTKVEAFLRSYCGKKPANTENRRRSDKKRNTKTKPTKLNKRNKTVETNKQTKTLY